MSATRASLLFPFMFLVEQIEAMCAENEQRNCQKEQDGAQALDRVPAPNCAREPGDRSQNASEDARANATTETESG